MYTLALLSIAALAQAIVVPDLRGRLGHACRSEGPSCNPGLVAVQLEWPSDEKTKCACVLKYVGWQFDRTCTFPVPLDPAGDYDRCQPNTQCKMTATGQPRCERLKDRVATVAKLGERCSGLGYRLKCRPGLECVTDNITFEYPGYCIANQLP